jgi:hypothetical protein
MDKKELTDVLYNIKTIIKNENEDTPKTQLRFIDDLVEWALAQEKDDFPVPKQELVNFLENFGNREFYSVCTGRISGEFCYAEYNYSDDDDIIFKLFWGVNDGLEKTTNEQTYWISIEDFKNSRTFQEKYDKVRD